MYKQQGYSRIEAAGIIKRLKNNGVAVFDLAVTENGKTTYIPCRFYHDNSPKSLRSNSAVHIEGVVVFNGDSTHVDVQTITPIVDFESSQGYQKTAVIGIMVGEPSLASTADDIKVTNFVVRADINGRSMDVPCQAWRGTALKVVNTLHEGHILRLDGRTVFKGWKSFLDVKRYHALNEEGA